MARYYRMTPARRAALRKAQIAAAKKRRRNRRIVATTASVAVIGSSAIAGYKVRQNVYGKRYALAHAEFVQKARARGRARANKLWEQSAAEKRRNSRILPQYGTDHTTFGRTRIGGGVALDNKGRQRGNRYGIAKQLPGQAGILVPTAKRGFKVNMKGQVTGVKRLRGLYDNNRRWRYNSEERSRKYLNWDKPRRQAQAAARKRAKGK